MKRPSKAVIDGFEPWDLALSASSEPLKLSNEDVVEYNAGFDLFMGRMYGPRWNKDAWARSAGDWTFIATGKVFMRVVRALPEDLVTGPDENGVLFLIATEETASDLRYTAGDILACHPIH